MNLVKKTTVQFLFFLISICLMSFTACEGPAGPEGPQGPQGEQGPQGPEGPAGEDANVTLYIFEAPDFTSGDPDHTFIIDNLTEDEVQSSSWKFSFIRGAFTQFIPGKISWGNDGDRSEITVEQLYDLDTGNLEIRVDLISGTDYFPDELHVFRIEPSNTISAKVNFKDYESLIEYYGKDNITVIDKRAG